MNYLRILQKFIKYIFYTLFLLIFIYLIYFINSNEPSDIDFRRTIKSILKKNTLAQHFFNDYREEYLPNTQFIKLDYKKIKLDFLNLNNCYFGKCYTFYLEQYQDNIIITDRYGIFRYAKFDDLKKDKKSLEKVPNNLNFDTVLDTFIIDEYIYVSGKKIVEDKSVELHVARANFNFDKMNFENIIKLKSNKCFFRHSVHSGKIQSYNENKDKIILSVNSTADNEGLENLSKDSVCGKILLIDAKLKKFEIFTSGHRNIIGMYADKNIILATEHGPFAGDEINKIQQGLSYGWPISSYGEKYSRGQSNEKPNFKKSHKDHGFEEPIFSFIPAIGISEIIKLPNNFSTMWQDNFLVGSLNGKHLYRVKFDNNLNKIIYHERIFVGDRIRDLIYNNESKEIYLSLELKGELGIISKSK